MTPTPALGKSRVSPSLLHLAGLLITLVGVLLVSGCITPVSISSNPPGAQVYVNGASLGATPLQAPLGDKAVSVDVRLEGYFPESRYVDPQTEKQVAISLSPTTLTKTYEITSTPAGASVLLDNSPVGTTPLPALNVVYTRDDKSAPWKPRTITVSKTDYQSESLRVSSATDRVPGFELTLLKDVRNYVISATTTDGQELSANVVFGGKVVGQTPLRQTLIFERPNKNAAWPKFDYTLDIPAKYKPVPFVVDYASNRLLAFKLEPIVEITTQRIGPDLVMTPTGIELKVRPIAANAVLSTREPAEIATDLKPVTDYRRKDLPDAPATRVEGINSFCIAPDGQNVIFSLTERDEDGNPFSNIFIKRSDDAAGGIARLTQGSRYLDTLPYIANDGSNYLVFASNRSDRNKTDIYRVNLIDNRLSGGISRLTNDNRFNFSPSYGDSNRQLFYLSTEPNFPKAEPIVSSIRMDGSLPTQMAITASEINNGFPDKLVFVRNDSDTKKKQIYTTTADGKLETALLNLEDFRKSDCINPVISPDGARILFVSDQGMDDQGRHNNDIYMCNVDGTGLQRLTQNGSDDIMPVWSPTEEGVIYFLSNRGGACNIWRMKLSSGSQ